MIRSFRHRGLRRLYESGDGRELRTDQIVRLRRILGVLDAAASLETIRQLPGLRLHPLKGDMRGQWSVWVNGNWRVTFRFQDENCLDLDLVDYH
jgi:proteic killer suppression protein